MTTPLDADERQIMVEAITDFNDRLVTHAINISGAAFNNAFRLGCLVLSLPFVVVLLVSYFSDRFDMTTFFVFGCAGVMISLVFASLISTRAKRIMVDDNYQEDINPDIVKFLSEHQFTRAQFDIVADDILGDNAPLRDYLIKVSGGSDRQDSGSE
jgi:hypothetical protein